MSVEVARKPVYPNGFEPESSSGDTEEFIKSVKDGLRLGLYDTTDKQVAPANSEDEQPSLPSEDEVDIDELGHGNSLTELVELPTSDDEHSEWLSPKPDCLARVIQTSPGVEDLVISYHNDNSINEEDNNIFVDVEQRSPAGTSNNCHVTKSLERRKTCCHLANSPVVAQLQNFLKERSKSLSHIDTSTLLGEMSFDLPEKEIMCNGNSLMGNSVKPTEMESSRTVPKRRSGSGGSVHRDSYHRHSGGDGYRRDSYYKYSSSGDSSFHRYSIGSESIHRFSEASSMSDTDSLHRRNLGLARRYSNYSTATTTHTNISSFLEPDAAIDLAENLMIELFDNDDIDGLIPDRFLEKTPAAIIDNIREEEYLSSSYSPTDSCAQSSFDEMSIPPNHNLPGEIVSEMRLALASSSPHNTGSPRSSHHSKSSSPERIESALPTEGGIRSNSTPRNNSMFPTPSMFLDTVEEETASQISPSPRILSPRISVDMGESFDILSDHHNNKHIQQASHKLSVPFMRKMSLQRDHRRISIDSNAVSENSFYFSVYSYDDDVVSKLELTDDVASSPKTDRRHRRVGTVTTPSSNAVLQWLANMPPDTPPSLDPDEPWPFNEADSSTGAPPDVNMETLTVPERKFSLSESSDLESFYSCHDDYPGSNISGQDSFDCSQLEPNQNEQTTAHMMHHDSTDNEGMLCKVMSSEQQPTRHRHRLKQHQDAIDYDNI